MTKQKFNTKKICGVYSITNLKNGYRYIGLSIDIHRRWTQHKHELRENKHSNEYLQAAWNKVGENNFKFEILGEYEYNKIDDMEKYWIKKYKTMKYGYNQSAGGEGHKDHKKIKRNIRKRKYKSNIRISELFFNVCLLLCFVFIILKYMAI